MDKNEHGIERNKRGHFGTKGAAAVKVATSKAANATPSVDPYPTRARFRKSLKNFGTSIAGSSKLCQYPLWPDPSGPGHSKFGIYCGKKVAKGSYCEKHYIACWNTPAGIYSLRMTPKKQLV